MQVACAKCAAKIELLRDDPFLSCAYCGSTLYLDRAHTFLRFDLPPNVSETRAKDLFAQELRRREVAPQPVRSVQKLLLPFWAVRGAGTTTTTAAFSPEPAPLAGYRLPPSGAVPVEGDAAAGGFEPVACSETATSRWGESGTPAGLALHNVPFFRLVYGAAAGHGYEAWVDGVTGAVFLGETPPALALAIGRRSMRVLLGLCGLFALEALLIPHAGLSLLAVAATAAVAYPFLRHRLAAEGLP